MSLKVLSLFSGCGGLDKGFSDAGYDIVWANDFDKYAVETYNANFENTSKAKGGERIYQVDYEIEPSEVVEVEKKEAPANVDKETGEIKVDRQSGFFDDDFEPVEG